jgi:hypothetical protein
MAFGARQHFPGRGEDRRPSERIRVQVELSPSKPFSTENVLVQRSAATPLATGHTTMPLWSGQAKARARRHREPSDRPRPAVTRCVRESCARFRNRWTRSRSPRDRWSRSVDRRVVGDELVFDDVCSKITVKSSTRSHVHQVPPVAMWCPERSHCSREVARTERRAGCP